MSQAHYGDDIQRLKPGQCLGWKYEIVAFVAGGGGGQVYRARDRVLGREVAIKIGPQSVDAAARRVLGDEAIAQAKVRNQHVVGVYEYFEEPALGGAPCIVLEYVEGMNLRDWLDTRPPRIGVLRVFEQAAKGLAAVHACEIVHRDFKPENVLVGNDGIARLADFGLAMTSRALEHAAGAAETAGWSPSDRSAKTITGALRGSPPYMSPEQHLRREPTEKSDVFSLCLSLHEALWGSPFREGLEGEAYRQAVIDGALEPPPVIDTDLASLHRLVRRGLTPAPDARPAAIEVVDELHRVSAWMAGRGRRRWRNLAIAGAVAMAALLGFAVVTGVGGMLDELRARALAKESRRVLKSDGRLGFLLAEKAVQMAATPDARGALMESLLTKMPSLSVATGLGSERSLKLVAAAEVNGTIALTDGRVVQLWSPSGELKASFPNIDDDIRCLALSGDGSLLLVGSSRRTSPGGRSYSSTFRLTLWDDDGSLISQTPLGDHHGCTAAEFSHDGTLIAISGAVPPLYDRWLEPIPGPPLAAIGSASFLGGDEAIVFITDGGLVDVRTPGTWEPRAPAAAHPAAGAMVSAKHGRRFATMGYRDTRVTVWELGVNEPVAVISADDPMDGVVLDGQGDALLAIVNGNLLAWDLRAPAAKPQIQRYDGDDPTGFGFITQSANGASAASAVARGRIVLWDWSQGINLRWSLSIPGVDAPTRTAPIFVGSSGRWVTTRSDGTLEIWSPEEERSRWFVGDADYRIWKIHLDTSCQRVVVELHGKSYSDQRVEVIDLQTNERVRAIPPQNRNWGIQGVLSDGTIVGVLDRFGAATRVVQWDPRHDTMQTLGTELDDMWNGYTVAVNKQETAVSMLRTLPRAPKDFGLSTPVRQACVRPLNGERACVPFRRDVSIYFNPILEMSPRNDLFLANVDDEAVEIFDFHGMPVATPLVHEGVVFSAKFSGDGRRVVTASPVDGVRVWSREGREVRHVTVTPAMYAISDFSGGQVLSMKLDGEVTLWNVDSPHRSRILPETAGADNVSFSADGTRVLVHHGRPALINTLWDASGHLLAQLDAPAGAHAEFSPDGRLILAADSDEPVLVWNRDGEDQRELAPLKVILGRSVSKIGASWDRDSSHVFLWGENLIVRVALDDAEILREASARRPGSITSQEARRYGISADTRGADRERTTPPRPESLKPVAAAMRRYVLPTVDPDAIRWPAIARGHGRLVDPAHLAKASYEILDAGGRVVATRSRTMRPYLDLPTRASGPTLYTIVFKPVDGWETPPSAFLALKEGETFRFAPTRGVGDYVPSQSFNRESGTIDVSTSIPEGRFLMRWVDGAWAPQPEGPQMGYGGLPAESGTGTAYEITFLPVPGWKTPSPVKVRLLPQWHLTIGPKTGEGVYTRLRYPP